MTCGWLSGRAARAVVKTGDTFYLLHIRDVTSPRQVDERLAALFFDQCPEARRVDINDEFPFGQIAALLRKEWERDRALRLVIMSVDKCLSRGLRDNAASLADRLLRDSRVEESVTNRLMSSPLPREAALGASGKSGLLRDLLVKVTARREEIVAAQRAWESVAILEGFRSEESARFRTACIELGGFTQFVRALGEKNAELMRDWLESAREAPELNDNRARFFLALWHMRVLEQLIPAGGATQRRKGRRHRVSDTPTLLERRGDAREAPRHSDNIRRLFEAVGAEWLEVEAGVAAEEELGAALKRLKKNLTANFKEVSQDVKQERFFSAIVPYSPGNQFGGFFGAHQHLEQFIAAAAFRLPRIGKLERRGVKTFEFALEKAARSARIVLLTHYFLTSRRRQHWGVVPFAEQRVLGLVFHNSNVAIRKYVEIARDSNVSPEQLVGMEYGGIDNLVRASGLTEIAIEGRDFPAALSQRLVAEMARSVVNDSGTLYYMRGYAMEEIIDDILVAQGETDLSASMPLYTGGVRERDGRREGNIPIFYKVDEFGASDESERPAEAVLKHGLCAFDPAHLPEIRKALGSMASDYTVLCVRHGLKIPVGIAFSLPFLPFLFLRDASTSVPLWKEIRDEAVRLYFQQESMPAVELMGQAGIEVRPSMLKNVGEAGRGEPSERSNLATFRPRSSV